MAKKARSDGSFPLCNPFDVVKVVSASEYSPQRKRATPRVFRKSA
jgi:hypothetical protein